MKKILPLSKIPNDIKYRLGLVETRLEDALALLTSIDPVAFPGGELDSLIVAVQDAAWGRGGLRAVQAVRPRKKTEVVDAVTEVAPDAPVDPVQDAV